MMKEPLTGKSRVLRVKNLAGGVGKVAVSAWR